MGAWVSVTGARCRYNPLEEEGTKAVVDVVKYNLPLKALKLGWCKLGKLAGAEHAAQLLQFNESLEVPRQPPFPCTIVSLIVIPTLIASSSSVMVP